ncbi:MAG TPA: efflux transporter outer membrane subunit [Myxococcales bacterium]|nr:efflux transporter outer membrane subunit [Myxococcales bacterium]
MNRSPVAFLALALAACSFAPKYERPEAGVPSEYRFAQPKESASVADLPWWELFKDPTLQDLIRVALANNQDLALAAARVDESRALVGVAKADLYPQVSAQVNAAYGRPISRNFNPGATDSARYGLSGDVSWEIDLWGRVRNSRDAAMADLLATEDFRRGVILALVSGVAQAYLELRALDLELEIDKSNTDIRKGTLDLFEARARRGVASDLEVSQAKADLALTTAAMPEAELAIAQKEHQICVLLGRAPGPIPRGSALVDTPVPPQLPLGVPAQLLGRRPDVLAAEQGVIGAGNRVGVAVANRLPTLSLAATIGLQGTAMSNLFGSDALAWNAGGGIFAPIFQGGRLAAEEEASRARLQQSVAAYRKTVQQALQEVADAAAGTIKLREARLARTDQVAANTRGAKLALDRYTGGVSSYFEVLDAQRQLYSAQLDLAHTQRDELTSVVLLYRALGGGWQQEEQPPPPPPAK